MSHLTDLYVAGVNFLVEVITAKLTHTGPMYTELSLKYMVFVDLSPAKQTFHTILLLFYYPLLHIFPLV